MYHKALLLLHILSAIIGFGGVFLNGIYGAQAKRRQGPEGLAIAEATYSVSRVASIFIYLVFVFGVLLVVEDDGMEGFGEGWISASMALYIIALGVSHGLLRPNVKKMNLLMAELVATGPPAAGGPPPQVAELERRGRTVGMASAGLNLALVLILYLMIWQPG